VVVEEVEAFGVEHLLQRQHVGAGGRQQASGQAAVGLVVLGHRRLVAVARAVKMRAAAVAQQPQVLKIERGDPHASALSDVRRPS
jgi:hypothetical protein